MVKDLPRDSRYVVLLRWRQAQEGEEVDDGDDATSEERLEQEERAEIRAWSDLSYELQALQVNLLQDLLRFVPSWKKTPEETERIGPPHWKKGEKAKGKKPEKPAANALGAERKPATVLDAMRAMGYDAPGQ